MPKRVHSASFKAKVALEAFRGEKTLSELAVQYGVHPVQISRWKKEFLDRAPELFDKPVHNKKEDADLEKLYAKIGQLEMEREFLKKNLKKLGL